MDDNFAESEINSVGYWNKRFFDDWIVKGGRKQTAFFAALSCRELPDWFVEEARARKSTIFDYGCALGDALPVLQRNFPDSVIRGGDVAQVGLGLARALHPGFEFVDTNAIGEASKVADIVFCSNTLEHFENWREVLHRLAGHAKEYVLAVVPFEEEDRIDEHLYTFEFDSLPARLATGFRLLHLGVVDAGVEPETHWNGLQLIAIYGGKRRSHDRPLAQSISRRGKDSLSFDLRGVKSPAVPPLLASLTAMSRGKRQLARDGEALRRRLFEAETRVAEAHQLAQAEAAAHAAAASELARRIAELEQAHAAALAQAQSRAAEQIAALEAAEAAARTEAARRISELEQARAAALAQAQSRAAEQTGALEARLNGAVREYTDLTRGVEGAQRWLLDALTALDPDLIANRQISPVPEGWPVELSDPGAVHRATIARLIEAVHRANRLGMIFHEQATGWRSERGELKRQLQEIRRTMERAVGERDRASSRALALQEMAGANRTSSAATQLATGPADSGAAPLVSIVLPVYNQAYLVDEAIAGILSQTYENWELIVLDDGSTDDLANRVRHYLGDRRVVFLRQPNQKLPSALNHGFAHARGELLTWTSADNIMLPTQVERLVAELAAYPNVGLVYSDYWAIDDKGQPLDDSRWRPHNRDPEIPDLIRLPDAVTIENFHRSGDNFIGASFMYRRTIAAIVGRYADDTFGGEDYDFWLRMHLLTEFRHVAEPLYKYRVHRDTLTARAEELGLFANIRELLEADRWRIDTLLTDGSLKSSDSLLRPVDQFHAALLTRCRPVAYRDLVERAPTAAADQSSLKDPAVVDIDVPARAVDGAVLNHADILLCRSDLTAALLRRKEWARDKRVIAWNGELIPAVQHAFIQAFAEQVTTPVTAPIRHALPGIDDPFRPARVLLLVDRWSSGGLENIVIDLALSLADNRRTVFVASAQEAPPPASAFASTQIQTMSFGGDERAFEDFLRREAIEVVNYHHSRFAADRARQQGVATVYTMHNSYLWMDDATRQQVGSDLCGMDLVIAVSRQVAQFGAAQFGVPADRMVVIANGLGDEIITPPARPALAGGSPFTVAMVASLARPKLQHIAIAAFAKAAQDIPEMRLCLIGAPLDRGYHDELQAQIAASPQRDRIELIAGLTRADTMAALASAQVFLLPSLVEGCSMALLEAAAAGCVCIASDVGSARDLLVAGGSVVLLPSPLGELDWVTQQQFVAAATAELPEHRENIAEALRSVWRDYGSFAAGVAETRTRLRELSGMRQMSDAYLSAYTMAHRRLPPRHRREPQAPRSAQTVGAGAELGS